jgi:hypothetical protein
VYAQTGALGAQSPRIIAYQGYLEHDGVPVNGAEQMRFFIASTDSFSYDGSSCSGACLWHDTAARTVTIANGYFTVELGPLPQTIFNGTSRYLGVRVGTTTLSERQRILSAPYAMTADAATNFTVSGSLKVGSVSNTPAAGELWVENTAHVGGLATQGTVSAATITGGNVIMLGNVQAAGEIKFGSLSGFRIDGPYGDPGVIAPSADRVCFLTAVGSDLCYVAQSGSGWILTGDDCLAMCLRWD